MNDFMAFPNDNGPSSWAQARCSGFLILSFGPIGQALLDFSVFLEGGFPKEVQVVGKKAFAR